MTHNNSKIVHLKNVDVQLSKIFELFNQVVNDIELDEICRLSDENTIKSKCNYPGIYLIEMLVSSQQKDIEEWIKEFKDAWEAADYKDKHTPSTKKKRISQHQQLKEWMPIYLGKSKNISNRVMAHLDQPLEKTMFALKLKARNNLPSLESFRLRALNLEKLSKENYDLIVPRIEYCLREKLNPIVGKQ